MSATSAHIIGGAAIVKTQLQSIEDPLKPSLLLKSLEVRTQSASILQQHCCYQNGALPTTDGTTQPCCGGAKDAFVAGVALARMKAEGGMPFGGSRSSGTGPGAVLGDAPRAAADALNVLTALLLALEDTEEIAIW